MTTFTNASLWLKVVFTASALLASFTALAQSKEEVAIEFHPSLSGESFECGKSYSEIGKPPLTITPTDWRMFITGVSLRDSTGQWISLELVPDGVWQDKQVVLIDFENGKGPCRNGTAGTNRIIKGRVPPNQYSGIQFKIGVPFELNHKDPTTANPPLSTTAMFWNWQGGYKFIKFDAITSSNSSTTAPAVQSAFSFHLGSTLCSSSSSTIAPQRECKKPNTVFVQLTGQDPRITPIVFDMSQLLRESDLSINTPQTPPGCMSTHTDPDCASIFRNLRLTDDSQTAQHFQFIRWGR